MSPNYIAFPRLESMVLIEPPMNVIATIAATATSARMSAYSAKPWPVCPHGTCSRTDLSLTLRSTSTYLRRMRRTGKCLSSGRLPI